MPLLISRTFGCTGKRSPSAPTTDTFLVAKWDYIEKYGICILCTNCRYQFIRDYTLKSLRVKIDKWNKLWGSDEQRHILQNFVETGINFFRASIVDHY